MTSPSDDYETATQFDAGSRAEWLALVERALKGASFEKSLTTRTLDGIEIAPIYSGDGETPLVVPRATATVRNHNANWDIRVCHRTRDAAETNSAILEDLNGGAHSVVLQMEAPGQRGLEGNASAMAAALEGVRPEMVHLAILAGDQYLGAAMALMAFWETAGTPRAGCTGAFNADPLGALARTGALEDSLFDSLRTLGHFVSSNHGAWPGVTLMLADARPYHDTGASEAEELACLLATLIAYLRIAEEEGVAPYKALPKIAVALCADADEFSTIAKFRALRLLLARVAQACGAEAFAASVPVWAETSARMLAERDLHTNMLRLTVAATGAILGGADALTVLPHTWRAGETTTSARRYARNVHHVLAEEAHLGRVRDPAAGSWYVDALTRDIAEAAWSVMQDIERGGGMENALRSGALRDRIARTAEARREAIASGAQPIVGVTRFQSEKTTTSALEPLSDIPPASRSGEQISPLPAFSIPVAADGTPASPKTGVG